MTIEKGSDERRPPEQMKSDKAGQDLATMRKVLWETPCKMQLAFLDKTCMHCGLCADACHLYLSTGDEAAIPAVKSEIVTGVFHRHFKGWRARLHVLGGERGLSTQEYEAVYKAAFLDCTLCGRCGLTCPMGNNLQSSMHMARVVLDCVGHMDPSGLGEATGNAIKTGNYLKLAEDDFVESVEWIAEELEDDLEIEGYKAHIDKEGAAYLFVPHPLEVRDFPMPLSGAMKLLYAAGEDYTFSTHCYDAVNYAYYKGDRQSMKTIFQRMLDAREKLGAGGIVMSPCGHGYRVLHREGPRALNRELDFPALTLVQLLARYLDEGRLKVNKDTIEGPITFHDPCNIGRLGGVIDEPRKVLNALTSQFVEMEPHGARSICCGGGGGLSSTSEYVQRRLEIGKAKAEQIEATGARIVATNCFNCMTQIRDLIKKYELKVEVQSIVELLADSVEL